jgi:dTDP-4-amino-4,6-dideoxygalactose transaminase
MTFAHEHNLIVIEDVAQSIGASFGGKALGTIGLMGCFSFYPGKNLGGVGEGGLITTNDKDIAVRLRALRSHGQYERYVHTEIGFNYRMDGVQGLVLGYKLKKLDEWTEQRKRIAIRYINQLTDLPIELPKTKNGDHVWHLFVIRTSHRDKLREYMINEGVETGLHYPVPLQRQPCLSGSAADIEDYPIADEWADNALSLPIFAGMTSEQQNRVIKTLRGFFEK